MVPCMLRKITRKTMGKREKKSVALYRQKCRSKMECIVQAQCLLQLCVCMYSMMVIVLKVVFP